MNIPETICPKCLRSYDSATFANGRCPNCGEAVDVGGASAAAVGATKSRGGWLVFVMVLLVPAILTFLTAKSENLWPVSTFIVGAGAALYCGFWMAWRICRTNAGKVIVGLALSVGFYWVSFVLCCAGCAIGGAALNIH